MLALLYVCCCQCKCPSNVDVSFGETFFILQSCLNYIKTFFLVYELNNNGTKQVNALFSCYWGGVV